MAHVAYVNNKYEEKKKKEQTRYHYQYQYIWSINFLNYIIFKLKMRLNLASHGTALGVLTLQ